MGIFDFFLKGPQLTKSEAGSISFEIAMKLFGNEISHQELVINAESILEEFFVNHYPDHSIEPDQSRQIFRLALLLFEKDKEQLKFYTGSRNINKRMIDNLPVNEETGEPYWGMMTSLNMGSPPDGNVNYDEHLTLFKD